MYTHATAYNFQLKSFVVVWTVSDWSNIWEIKTELSNFNIKFHKKSSTKAECFRLYRRMDRLKAMIVTE
jgi:hypothetical protein